MIAFQQKVCMRFICSETIINLSFFMLVVHFKIYDQIFVHLLPIVFVVGRNSTSLSGGTLIIIVVPVAVALVSIILIVVILLFCCIGR